MNVIIIFIYVLKYTLSDIIAKSNVVKESLIEAKCFIMSKPSIVKNIVLNKIK